jgi:hypothetical protein
LLTSVPDALVAAPAGRAVLAALAGVEPFDLLAMLGEPMPAGTVRLRGAAGRAVGAGTARRARRAIPAGRRAPAEVIAAAVGAVDLAQLAGCRDRLLLLSVLADVIEGQQAAAGAALEAAGGALLPVARALAAAPAARWWWQPLDRTAQRWAGPEGATLPRGSDLSAAVGRAIAQEQPDVEPCRPRPRLWGKREVDHGGPWWSAPLGGTVFTTTGSIGSLPAVELACEADSAGEEQLRVWAAGVDAAARVKEIGRPADWAGLVGEFPRDVTAVRRYDWDSWTGQTGPWVLPDWSAVARSWDGVHLSVGGYLTATGLAIPAGDGTTLLAGWEADRTLWLNDVFTGVEYVQSWRGETGSAAVPRAVLPWLAHH